MAYFSDEIKRLCSTLFCNQDEDCRPATDDERRKCELKLRDEKRKHAEEVKQDPRK